MERDGEDGEGKDEDETTSLWDFPTTASVLSPSAIFLPRSQLYPTNTPLAQYKDYKPKNHLVSAVSRKPHPGKGLANSLQRHPSHGIKFGTGHIGRTLGEMLCLDFVSPLPTLLNALRIQFSHSTNDLEKSYDRLAFNSVNIDFR